MLFRVRTQWNIFFIKYESGPSLFYTTCVNFTVSWSVCNFKINLVFFFMFFFFSRNLAFFLTDIMTQLWRLETGKKKPIKASRKSKVSEK